MPNDETVQSGGIDRRQLLKRGALVTGAAWVAPMVIDSFASPAFAANTPLLALTNGPTSGNVTVPKNRQVAFIIIGGGGGGGGFYSYCGGSGTKVEGKIAANVSTSYTLNWNAAGGGGRGRAYPNAGTAGAAGAGHKPGGAGTGGATGAGGGSGRIRRHADGDVDRPDQLRLAVPRDHRHRVVPVQ